ncbi:MAG: Ammonia channel precursor [candidate division BRC1 bacterium ADurb.BinA292]|nr:MAG: Ammonia channel precursor [candidate division BRC1 bacterium ADurb.BinA292]
MKSNGMMGLTGRLFRSRALLGAAALLLMAGAAWAQEEAGPSAEQFSLNNLLLLLSGALVFWMHAGFACVESGLTQAKNTVNILSKNVIIVCLGGVSYFIIGFGLMYPGEFNHWIGFGGSGFGPVSPEDYGDYTIFTDFFFQAVFAATAATIISGAVAERIKFASFIVVALLFVTFIYPIAGSWVWGGGWLTDLGFKDFAGSTVVHSIGGWAALTGAVILGPRRGKYTADGIRPIVGHSMPLATIGVFILFLGWFGFNGGSVLAMDSGAVSMVYVTTFLAGCAGGIGAMLASWIVLRKPDITMILNGILAGLVGITAGADTIAPWPSLAVGAIAGVIVVFSVVTLDRIKVDDPVGAISVHLVCGVWGTLAVGIFSFNPDHGFLTQLIGIVAIGVFVLVTSTLAWLALKHSPLGLRVSEEEEVNGLDTYEHGLEAYPEFKSTTGIL